tara:strand:+ start:5439 stop:6107 length:669 start_codon:yes stop_codon:yes gene_type:complete
MSGQALLTCAFAINVKMNRNMGNWTSGNHSRDRRLTTDELPFIHVSDISGLPLLPELWITPPTLGIRNLRVIGSHNRAVFGAKAQSGVIEIGSADLMYSARNFGGQQAYFLCECGKRVTRLYMGDSRIACRLCHGLLYKSQLTPGHEQLAAKAARLRARIGGPPALLQPLPDKPKYMHRETYDRITYQILTYELAAAKEQKKYMNEKWVPVLLKLDELAAQC